MWFSAMEPRLNCPVATNPNLYYANSYAFIFHADSRDFGQEPKMRTHFDPDNSNMVLIPDPTRTALTQGTIIGWRVFIQQISMQHQVYFQVGENGKWLTGFEC